MSVTNSISAGVSAPPNNPQIAGTGGNLTSWYQAWFSTLARYARCLGTTGTTTARPLNTALSPLYVGFMYFDTTLGYPVWVKSIASNGTATWVNGAGATV